MLFLLMFVGGALLIPWLYGPIRYAAQWLGVNADPFPRYIQRAIPIVALLIIPLLTRWAGLKSAADLGIVAPSGQWQKFLFGFLAALLALAMICSIIVLSGALTLRDGITVKAVLDKFAAALGSALIVALMEEIIFRGAVLTLLTRIFSWPTALISSSAIFSLVHFLHRPEYAGPVTWDAGLLLLPAMFAGLLDFQNMGASAANLFLAAMLIGSAYGYTGNLYCSMGLHAGAVVSIKLSLAFTTVVPGAATRFWGTGVLIDSWFTVAALFLAVALFGLNSLRSRRLATDGPQAVAAFSPSFKAVWLAHLAVLAAGVVCAALLRWLS
jgi:membrane protease YdiL (CAAX protease family)